jgi:hypothetical protein
MQFGFERYVVQRTCPQLASKRKTTNAVWPEAISTNQHLLRRHLIDPPQATGLLP